MYFPLKTSLQAAFKSGCILASMETAVLLISHKLKKNSSSTVTSALQASSSPVSEKPKDFFILSDSTDSGWEILRISERCYINVHSFIY